MDAGLDALRPLEPPLGAIPVGDGDLGPVSPELALVDPDLARQARALLPEPRERPRPQRPPQEAPVPKPPAEPKVRPRRRWPRTLALAIVIFAVGAVSGSLLGNHQTGWQGSTLEVRAASHTARQPTPTRAVLRPPRVVTTRTTTSPPARTGAVLRPPTTAGTRTTTSPLARPRQRRRHARVAWASNVLGVQATVSRDGVALVWQRPADSARVVVLRKRGTDPSIVVYRGRATSYRDTSPRPCTGVRYTIVNYDRRGHRSTGVPTSVLTRCA